MLKSYNIVHEFYNFEIVVDSPCLPRIGDEIIIYHPVYNDMPEELHLVATKVRQIFTPKGIFSHTEVFVKNAE